ncbi:MAG: hypothetical protein IKK80_06780 [Treponema sp.]|nr:hypothetical protein [Treponema sp.]
MSKSIRELLYLTYSCLITKFSIPSARLLRQPIDIRGKKGIDFGKKLTTGYHCRLESFCERGKKSLVFGNNIQINDFVHIAALNEVRIGDNVLIASKVFITDLEHGSYAGNESDSSPDLIVKERPLSSKSVIIKDNVWLGEHVSVLPGVTVGENSIIGANSVVTKSIPANSIAVGIPAKVIKQYNFETKRWEKV